MKSNTIDRSALVVWFWLAIVGIILMLVGWFRAALG
jgi:hypothetical protein